MNLAGIADWEPGFPFRNLIWGARKWSTRNVTDGGPWDTGKADAMPVDADGYPLAAPFTPKGATPQIPFTLLPSVRPAGRFLVRWEGDGEIGCGLSSRLITQSKGRATIEIVPQGDDPVALLSIVRSNPQDHLRDLTVVAEGDAGVDLAKEPFLPEFLRFVKPFPVCDSWTGRARTGPSSAPSPTGRSPPPTR